ncbi:hypothetical protein BDW59DRAFT_178067 [Aspergillus cavernicola]|uniref:YHYH domain-containing protein n=1 Tax=Aspergillus cavernicola TaxID=176166 RepID=A0ABR4HFA7_9EURO
MVVSGACHYAKDRPSFITYRPVCKDIKDDSPFSPTRIFVAGIGTVELSVRSSPEKNAPTRTLVLDQVLHIPSALSNGFNMTGYHYHYGGAAGVLQAKDADGHPFWHAEEFCGLGKLVLAGNPQGLSYSKEGKYYALSSYISPEDIKRS